MSRVALLLAAAAALAGCSVELEGAACATPGEATQCPEGQACGYDLRCSERAAEASCAFCEPATTACGAGDSLRTCVAGDAVCNRWETAPCAAGLECPSGATACACADPGDVVGVDPERSFTVTGGGPPPTGALAPPGCRLPTLDAGLAAPGARTVRVYRGQGGTTVIDLAATLVVPAGIELTTDASPAEPASFTLQGDLDSADLVHLEGGATLRGFTLRSTGASGDVLEVVCGAESGGAPAVLDGLIVDGNDLAARGVVVAGACSGTASALEVLGAVGDGVRVASSAADVGLAAVGVSLHDNGDFGARVSSGLLSLTGAAPLATVHGNDDGGVRVEGGVVNATLDGLLMEGNGGVGLYVNVEGGAVRVTGTTLAKNQGTAYGPVPQPLAGGVILAATPPSTFQFTGNTICSNQGDELGVYSSAAWSIAGGDLSCADHAAVNHLGDDGRLVNSTSGAVNAQYNFWAPNDPPSVSANVDYDPSCGILALPAACN